MDCGFGQACLAERDTQSDEYLNLTFPIVNTSIAALRTLQRRDGSGERPLLPAQYTQEMEHDGFPHRVMSSALKMCVGVAERCFSATKIGHDATGISHLSPSTGPQVFKEGLGELIILNATQGQQSSLCQHF